MWTDWLYVWLGAEAAFIFRGLFLIWVNRVPEPDLASRMHESRERIEREIADAQRVAVRTYALRTSLRINRYSLPADFSGRVLEAILEGRSDPYRLLEATNSAIADDGEVGYPLYFWIENGHFCLYPYPDDSYYVRFRVAPVMVAGQIVHGVNIVHRRSWVEIYAGHNGNILGKFRAYERSLDLMRDWLTPQQRKEYDTNGYFHARGCHTGKTYRIYAQTVNNVQELADGKPAFSLCFQPDSNASFFAGDVMLAQKLALETNERAALRVANRTPLNPYA